MAKEPLRVGIIGTGMIATTAHIPAFKNLGDAIEIVAVADILGDRARDVAESEDIPQAFDDWREMLDKVELDIVAVCTPNSYHCEQSIAALKAGAHVICEKPVATCREDAVKMFDAAEAAGKVLYIGQSSRWINTSIAAKEIVDAGTLGEMYYAETYYLRRRGIPTWGQFHMKEHSGGGPVYDLGVHAIDTLFWVMGGPKVTAVSSMCYTKLGNIDEGLAVSFADSGAPIGVLTPRPYSYTEFDVEDMAAGFIRLEGDVTVAFKTSWAANIPEGGGGSLILGTKAGLTLDPLRLVTNMGSYQVNVQPLPPGDRNVAFAAHWDQADHLVKVIRGEEEQLVKRDVVLNVIGALDALYQSAAEGREIRLD